MEINIEQTGSANIQPVDKTKQKQIIMVLKFPLKVEPHLIVMSLLWSLCPSKTPLCFL